MAETEPMSSPQNDLLNEPEYPSEFSRPSLADTMRERIDRYLHPVSHEAEEQMRLIREVLPEGALSKTLGAVEPMFRGAMRGRDKNAVLWNIFSSGFRLSLGAASFFIVGRQRNRLDKVFMSGVGAYFTLAGMNTPSFVGLHDRGRIYDTSLQIQRYYATDVGKNAALGKGLGETESLTNQVDLIVRRITLGDIPTVSGAMPH